jgi:hypothetical protein
VNVHDILPLFPIHSSSQDEARGFFFSSSQNDISGMIVVLFYGKSMARQYFQSVESSERAGKAMRSG